jgi:hypothetical protein
MREEEAAGGAARPSPAFVQHERESAADAA